MDLFALYQPFAKMQSFETIEVNATLAGAINQRLSMFHDELNLVNQTWLRTSLHLLEAVGVGGPGTQSVHPDSLRFSTDRAAELLASWTETDKQRFVATPVAKDNGYGVRYPLGYLDSVVYTKDEAVAKAASLNVARDGIAKPAEPVVPAEEVFQTVPSKEPTP